MFVTEAPQPPIDCSLHNETSALAVNCVPGADGGLPQHFLLEVRGSPRRSASLVQDLHAPQSDQGGAAAAGGETPPIYQEKNQSPSFQLHDLTPGLDYTLAVYAVNGRGRSQPVLLEHVRVVRPLGSRLESNGGGVIFGIGASLLPGAATQGTIVIAVLSGKLINQLILLFFFCL